MTNLLSRKNIFEKFLARTRYDLSAFAFVNLFAWKDFFDFEFKMIDGFLCVFARNALGVFLYLPPLGRNLNAKIIDACFDLMFKENKGRGVSRIENVEVPQLKFFPSDKYTIFKKSDDFVYDRKELAELRGNKYKSKRSSYNQFARRGKGKYVPYAPKMRSACLKLYDGWAAQRKKTNTDDIYRTMIDESQKAHALCLRYYKELGLVGRVVMAGNEIIGYTFGFELKKNVFCVLFEVTDLDVKGLSGYIFKEFCADKAVKQFKFINVMDDFGLENIRATKMSFKPCACHAAYVVSRKS